MKKIVFFFILIATFHSVSAQKDSIVLNNKNKLVGEIQSLDKSVLTISTSYSDSDFKIKWHRVKEVYSNRLFIVSLSNGSRFNTTINTDSINKNIVLLDQGEFILESTLDKVIYLDAIGKNFLSRLTAEFDIGITLTKANNSKQLTGNALIKYNANKWSLNNAFSSVYNRQDGVEDIKRIENNTTFQWYLKNEWFLSTSAVLLSNNEQLLQLRTTAKLGAGYYFRRNNSMAFAAGSGLAYSNEEFIEDANPSRNSIEFYFGSEFNKYEIGDLSLLTSIFGYPSITEKGRFRVDFKFDMKYDLPWDFYIKTGITYNFDNQPAQGATKDDYVLQTSFGWELD
ncbi:DUF481 domain-containing protein [Urechidicola vernalis]|uniref:DUF481 domain-containing protein n=1 Tax=Urechidicola vernalis TaxID=3075600 RepID=A0ABU2Y5Y3_9FLAO|nr:DUF481 domain-containing protein [Urechidicola sp. P050]MDT0553612.1 DUF481 domain-containing protein [Urechidicola sp. P050]